MALWHSIPEFKFACICCGRDGDARGSERFHRCYCNSMHESKAANFGFWTVPFSVVVLHPKPFGPQAQTSVIFACPLELRRHNPLVMSSRRLFESTLIIGTPSTPYGMLCKSVRVGAATARVRHPDGRMGSGGGTGQTDFCTF